MAKPSPRIKNRSAKLSYAHTGKIVPLFREYPARRSLSPVPPSLTVTTVAGYSHQIFRTSSLKPGEVTALHQWQQGLRNGPVSQAMFSHPAGVVVSTQGTLFVADTHNQCIRKITPQGRVSTWVGSKHKGHHDGRRTQAQLDAPMGLAQDSQGTLYTPALEQHCVRQIDSYGRVSSLALPGRPSTAIATDWEDYIYVGCTFKLYDTFQHGLMRGKRGQWYILVKEQEQCHWLAYQSGDDAKPFTPWSPYQAMLPQPFVLGEPGQDQGHPLDGLATAPDGTLYLATQGHILCLKRGQIAQVKGSKDIYHPQSDLSYPKLIGLVVDDQHNLYLTDPSRHCIRKLSSNGYPVTLQAAPTTPESQHLLEYPHGLALDRQGRLYVSDTAHGRICQIHSPLLAPVVQLYVHTPQAPPPLLKRWVQAIKTGFVSTMKQFLTPREGSVASSALIIAAQSGPQLNQNHIDQILNTASRSTQLELVRELLALYRQSPPLTPHTWRTCWQQLMIHPDISLRTMLLREVPQLVQQEPDALMWIALMAENPEPNRILRKQRIQVLDYLGKVFKLYSHVIPVIVDFMGDSADDVVKMASDILMGIRQQGYASLVDPLVEELAGG